MEDDLEKLREQKKEQLQETEESEEALKQRRESIKNAAYQHMTQEAISRIGNVKTAKPELAEAVLAQIARIGETTSQEVDDDTLKNILREIKDEKENDDSNISFRK